MVSCNCIVIMNKPLLFLFLIVFVACTSQNKSNQETSESETSTTEVASESTAPKSKADKSNMIYFPGGDIMIGSANGLPDEVPMFNRNIKPFHLDMNLVTVAEFRAFIQVTGHKTDAEKYGDSGVYDFEKSAWSLVKGAKWDYPLGPDQPKAEDNHPVTHVSWNDASAYAKWVGKRLPTEFEWEYAAKNGGEQTGKYAWGDDVVMGASYMANTFQGNVTDLDTRDGFLLTSPVGEFGRLESGLTDMGGNVWQWCANVFEPYPNNTTTQIVQANVKTVRGGSFMYDEARDLSFTTTYRSKNTDDTSLFNIGFRCAL